MAITKVKEINQIIQKNILNGAKIPHNISQPVIYEENGKYYLAVFVFFFTREDIQAGMVDRPTVWAVADLETGKIIEEYQCKDKDFTNASFDVKCSIRSNASKQYYDEASEILDSVRKKLITTGKFYNLEYQYYMKKIMEKIPRDYKRFYTDLSV